MMEGIPGNKQDAEIAKTLASYIDHTHTTIDSGYGSESLIVENSIGLDDFGNTFDEKLILERETEHKVEQTPEEKQQEDFFRHSLLPALTPDNDGDTYLHILSSQRRLEEMQQLIQLCPDSKFLDIQNKQGQAAIHISTYLDLADIVKMLICKNARIDLVDGEGNNILHLCAKKGHLRSLNSIMESCEQIDRMKSITKLLEETNYNGWTPFYTAVVHKNKDICALLVEKVKDINVNAMDIKTGNSPLHEAVMGGNNADLVYFLLKYCNVDVNFRNKQNIVPLHIAASIGDEAICAVLLQFNAQCDIRDDNGNTPSAYTANERIFKNLTV